MPKSRRSLFSRIISRIPQTLYLKPDTYIHVRDLQDHQLYWDIFTGPEYLRFLPYLSNISVSDLNLIDCGAANGLFTLWIYHMAKIEVLPFRIEKFFAIEPSTYQLKALRRNLKANIPDNKHSVLEGIIGKKSGSADFHEAREGVARLGSSYRTKKAGSVNNEVQFVDLTPYLDKPCLLKLDIEGGEFDFVENYSEDLGNIVALIVEWHLEMGDADKGARMLKNSGLNLIHCSLDGRSRRVELYMRN